MPSSPTPRVAVVGGGPSGCYLAQFLVRAVPGCDVTVFDRLVSPFGLVRYGVAADHQHTKAITRQFDRLFQSGAARFAGGVEVGRDVELEELRTHFDAVVLATGLSADRRLDLPGGGLPGVVGAGRITRTLNAHPDEEERLPELGSDVVVIGGGNVALDVLRFLVKDRAGFDASDVADAALDAYLERPAERVSLVSRSAAPDTKGDPQMLRELAALPRARYTTPDPLAPAAGAKLDRAAAGRVAALEELVSPDRPRHPGPEVTLRFGLTPVRVLGAERVEGVEFASPAGVVTIPASSVVTAIGFTAGGRALAALVAESSETGRLEPGLYRAGWAKRGPRGAIPENRACAKAVADEIAADLADGSLDVRPGRLGYAGLPAALRARAVDYAQWLALEAHERELAPEGRVRRKIPDHERMSAIARAAARAQAPQ